MSEGHSCSFTNPLFLTLCLTFFATLIFNVYLNYPNHVVTQKLPQIAKIVDDKSFEDSSGKAQINQKCDTN